MSSKWFYSLATYELDACATQTLESSVDIFIQTTTTSQLLSAYGSAAVDPEAEWRLFSESPRIAFSKALDTTASQVHECILSIGSGAGSSLPNRTGSFMAIALTFWLRVRVMAVIL